MASFHCCDRGHEPREPPPAAHSRLGAATTKTPASRMVLVSDVMLSLRAGVPLSLLADLVTADGPDSAGILLAEVDDVDDSWIKVLPD
jgi:hypothetical protein